MRVGRRDPHFQQGATGRPSGSTKTEASHRQSTKRSINLPIHSRHSPSCTLPPSGLCSPVVLALSALGRRNALVAPDERWRPEVDRLIERLESLMSGVQDRPTSPASSSTDPGGVLTPAESVPSPHAHAVRGRIWSPGAVGSGVGPGDGLMTPLCPPRMLL